MMSATVRGKRRLLIIWCSVSPGSKFHRAVRTADRDISAAPKHIEAADMRASKAKPASIENVKAAKDTPALLI
jgi:hypothetical protein